jgi:hypothetical protein
MESSCVSPLSGWLGYSPTCSSKPYFFSFGIEPSPVIAKLGSKGVAFGYFVPEQKILILPQAPWHLDCTSAKTLSGSTPK